MLYLYILFFTICFLDSNGGDFNANPRSLRHSSFTLHRRHTDDKAVFICEATEHFNTITLHDFWCCLKIAGEVKGQVYSQRKCHKTFGDFVVLLQDISGESPL